MADAIISMILKRLVPIIEKNIQREVSLLLGSADDAKKLASNLDRVQQVLRDAEVKGVRDPKVKSWLNKLQEISYEIDDVLDEWEWEKIRLEMDEVEYEAAAQPWEKVAHFFQSFCLCYKKVLEGRKVRLNVEHLNERLCLIAEENEREFKLIPSMSTDSHDFRRLITTSFVDVSEFQGRHEEKEILVSKLLSEGGSSSRMGSGVGVPIISIVGAGGMGKTTLAQAVFNDERVENHFDRRVWLCVSHPFDEIRIARAILGALKKNLPNVPELETLLRCIVEEVSGRNLLLVLDDVWTKDEALWKPLRICLNNGGPKSRILVTTRNTRVAQMMGSTPIQIQSLHPLSHTYCWELFNRIAFRDRTEFDCKVLEQTGVKIVKKCKGLPLAVKTVASLLHLKDGLEEWQELLNSQVWEWETAGTYIFSVLALSYYDLHPVAMRCFSFCAIFGKSVWINVDMLVRMWCAHGFLSSVASSLGDMELKGREIFDDLATRCFFQDFKKDIRNRVVYCKMHDIVHDFARFLTKDECLVVENVDRGTKLVYNQNALHLNLLMYGPFRDHIPILNERTRIFLIPRHITGNVIPPNLLRNLKRVRVLILRHCDLELNEIESLIHLRFLDLTGNLMRELPKGICDLYHLETLMLEQCFYLCALPQGIHKLKKLRHLLNGGLCVEFPDGFDELTNLWTLSEVPAANLAMLRNFNQLRGCLSINILSSENTDELVEAAKKADLKNKNLIQELHLCIEGKFYCQVMEALQPHQNLLILTFMGPRLPEWVATLTNLRELTIQIIQDKWTGDVGSFPSLPPLGKLLPFLEVLCLRGMEGMERLDCKFWGIDAPQPTESVSYAFPRLKILNFTNCRQWEEWEDISEEEENSINISLLPSLVYLELCDCKKLRTIPPRLLRKASSLKHVIIDGCDNLHASFKDSVQILTNQPGIRFPPNSCNYTNRVMYESNLNLDFSGEAS